MPSNGQYLPSLSIRNYRSLSDLNIERLGRVNLVVGPNNIGKSSLLEAILLWGTKRHLLTIRDILHSRDECDVEFPEQFQSAPFLGLHHLFTGFPELSSNTAPISITTLDGEKQGVSLRVFSANSDMNTVSFGPPIAFSLSPDQVQSPPVMPLGGSLQIPSNGEVQFKHYLDSKCLYLSPGVTNTAKVPLSKLWEQVEISGRETSVIESLRLIDSKIEKVFFIGSSPRLPVCRFDNQKRPVPLHSLGDGVSRLFELILCIVNVSGGICLIDEFENGLHWSVQEKVWDVVFQTARNLDVQVFATTHSQDAVKAFQSVVLRQADDSYGGIIQLKRKKDQTIAVPIFGDDIRKILQYEVEVR